MRKLSIIGTGYVGLVTGACFADLGNRVACIDVDAAKIATLEAGELPIYEPGLAEMVERNVDAGRLWFTTSYAEGLAGAEYAFIAVNTPPAPDGSADMTYVSQAALSIAEHLDHDVIVVDKSTVPVGTGHLVSQLLDEHKMPGLRTPVVSNPEFLREGSAINDCLHPDRIVLGSDDLEACERVASLYLWLRCPIMITDLATAEMIKYASNAMLATRISFINEVASVCERVGADVTLVAQGMGLDKRIGPAFLDAGLGYGGSCFPKDVQALIRMGTKVGCSMDLLGSVVEVNRAQRGQAVAKTEEALGSLEGKRIGLLGLAFKANTDDMREAPAVEIAAGLLAAGAEVRAYDPVAEGPASAMMPDVDFCPSPYEVAKDADAVILVTDWPEFRHLNLEQIKASMRNPLIVDGRNLYEPRALRALGFEYRGVGRP